MSNLRPIRLLPARERVAAALRKAILTQELKPDEEITLEGIAGQLGVSITPVREAFQILATDGLLQLRHNKEARILGFDEKTIHDHYQLREILEREAAAMVCENGADISAIEDAFEQCQQACQNKNHVEYSNYNQVFHSEIWAAAGNVKMEQTLSGLWNGLSIGYQVTEEEYARISLNEHGDLLEAIRKRDADLARTRMSAHILRSMKNVLTHYKIQKSEQEES